MTETIVDLIFIAAVMYLIFHKHKSRKWKYKMYLVNGMILKVNEASHVDYELNLNSEFKAYDVDLDRYFSLPAQYVEKVVKRKWWQLW